jgi:hypothetical protein
MTRAGWAVVGAVTTASLVVGGCVYRSERAVPAAPAASPSTTTVVVTQPSSTITYPEGRYLLYGDGKTTPYYWVWVPNGVTPPNVPPPPPSP